MKLAGSFEAAVEVAEQNCSEWIFADSGEVTHRDGLHEVAWEFDAKTPLGDDEFLAVTDDGSIGFLFPECKEPDWYYVSAPFAVVNMLHDDIRNYIIPVEEGATSGGGTGAPAGTSGVAAQAYGSGAIRRNAGQAASVFCKNCGAKLEPGARFCGNCGTKNAPEFCSNCGAKLKPESKFCENCGAMV